MSARTRELFGLIPVSLLVAAGFAAVLATRTEDVSDATITYGAVFLGLCVMAHLFIRVRLPDADPYLFPLAALLAAFGLVMIYRIDTELALERQRPQPPPDQHVAHVAQVAGQEDDDRELGELGGLELDRAELDGQERAVDLRSDAR